MSVRMKMTRSKTGNRRAHQRARSPRLSKDTESGNVHLRHFVDPKTGMYRGKQILAVASDTKEDALKEAKTDKKATETKAKKSPVAKEKKVEKKKAKKEE